MPSFASFVTSDLPSRIWRHSKTSGQPLPKFSDDDYLDFIVSEAVEAKGLVHEKELHDQAEANREREEWKKDFKGLEERLQSGEVSG